MKKGIHILILEDSPTDVELIERHLLNDGLAFTSERVDTKSAFIKALKGRMPDIILADYSLPSFDGISAMRYAKKIFPDIPTIIVSGTIGEELAVEALHKGAVDYVMKDKLSRLAPAICRALKEADEKKKRKKTEEALLKEIHHRVKNNLQVISSLLKLQSKYVKDERCVEILMESCNRIKSMAMIHEELYRSDNLSNIDCGSFLRRLVSSLISSYGVDSGRISVKIEADCHSCKIGTAIPCGLIINELISNSIKHAFPKERKGEIAVSFHKGRNNEIEFTVSDNGVGIPEGMDFKKTGSLGLHLVTIIAEDQLGGEVDLDRKGGTRFIVRFKDTEK